MVREGFITHSGFQPVYQNNGFKCAFITAGEQYAPGQIKTMKRHNSSDEVYALVSGKAVLVTGDVAQKQYVFIPLCPGVSYCVDAGTWHYLAVSEDGTVFVVENSDVSAANTDAVDIEKQYVIVEV